MINKENVFTQLAQNLEMPLETLHSANLSMKIVTLSKGEYFVNLGEKCDKIGLLIDGILRKCTPSNEGVELTTSLVFNGGFAAPYADMLTGVPSQMFIEALEKSTVAMLSYNELNELKINDPVWTMAALKITEALFMEKSQREMFLLSMNAKERLEHFIETHPTTWKRIPKNVIASYLGINPSTLSRLKSSK